MNIVKENSYKNLDCKTSSPYVELDQVSEAESVEQNDSKLTMLRIT